MIRATYIIQWLCAALFAVSVGFGIYAVAVGKPSLTFIISAASFALLFFVWGMNRRTELMRRETRRRSEERWNRINSAYDSRRY